jgi:hypothetical protein
MDTDAGVLAMWERGRLATPLQRALLLLGLALPGRAPDELARMSIGRRDRALTRFRRSLFGSGFDGHVDCPNCGERLGVEIELPAREEDASPVTEFVSDDGLRFRAPDSRDLAAVADAATTDEALRRLLRRCCISAPDQVPADWSAEQIQEAEVGLAALESDDELCIDFTCASCGHSWQSVLDPACVLWEELEAHAIHLLQTVHQLARAYGWTERDILSMPAPRRAAYLQLAQT